jgi:hypothetical protein
VDLWVHVGLQYLSPFRPTFLKMIKVASDGGEDDAAQGFITLQARTGDKAFRSLWNLLREVDLDLEWTVAGHEILETNMPIPKIRGGRVRVKHAGFGDKVVVWKGWQQEDEDRRREQERRLRRASSRELGVFTLEDVLCTYVTLKHILLNHLHSKTNPRNMVTWRRAMKFNARCIVMAQCRFE